jgi:hypothetical protein
MTMSRPKKLLIVQFPYDHSRSAGENLAFRHEYEDLLDTGLRQNGSGEVDGGELGPDGINLWICLTSWSAGIPVVEAYLKHRGVSDKVVIAKQVRDDKRKVIWPRDFARELDLRGPNVI